MAMSGIDEAADAFAGQIGAKKSPSGSGAEEVIGVEDMGFAGLADEDDFDDEVDETTEGDLETEPEKDSAKDSADEGDEEEEEDGEKGEEDGEEGGEKEGEDGKKEDKDGEADLDLNQTVRLTVDGADTELPLREVLDGYIRTETFHQRMNEVSSARDEVRQAAIKTVEMQNKYVDLVKQAEDILKAVMPDEPDWDALFREDPASARVMQKNYEAVKAQIDSVKRSREDAEKERGEFDSDTVRQYASSEWDKFLMANPGIANDEAKVKAEVASMRQAALDVGFSKDEVAQVYDSRMLIILQKAAKYDALKVKSKKAEVKLRKVVGKNSAASKRSRPAAKVTEANRRLQRTGSVDAAAGVFKNMIND